MGSFSPIFSIVGILLTTLAIGMCVPAAVDGVAGNPDWRVFLASAALTLFIGVALTLTTRSRGGTSLGVRQAFLLTTLSWVTLTAFAALPFAFSDLGLTYTDAFFEAMSGITTTGATVITGLDYAPPGILLWRALLQWLGGIGIIVMAIAVMPVLRVGGMQLFRMESSEKSAEKVLPRAAQIATGIGLIYLTMTALCAFAYWLAGMARFDAIAHAMTTIATGGFSTYDGSIGHFKSAAVDLIATVGMILGGLPFILYLRTLRGEFSALFTDSQVRVFLGTVGVLIAMIAGWLWLERGIPSLTALRLSAFNVVSVITGTGYATAAYDTWGGIAVPAFFFIMFIGGCAGSTTCGIKIFRFQVLYAGARAQVNTLVQPHGVFIPYYNRRPIADDVMISVMSFFFMFGITFAVLALGLGLLGLDFLTSVSGAATAISNVGPGLGPVIGPASTFQTLPDAAKWLLAIGMLLGRLEVFTVLVLFTRAFWRG